MALNLAGLKADLAALFASPPATGALCASQWSAAMASYASAVVPVSTGAAAGQAALESALASAFAAPSAVSGMETAFAAFATALATGMTAGGWTGTPPAGSVGFASLASSQPATHAVAANAFADLIHAWALTGTAVLIAPPNTPATWA